MNKFYGFILVFFITCKITCAQTLQPQVANYSDTVHIHHYKISVDSLLFSQSVLYANTEVTAVAKQNNITAIDLSLLQLTVDSVTSPAGTLTYTYNDTTLHINIASALQQNDTALIKVYYHGTPQTDASGFGGFYFTSNYAFNMGVGFDAIPHNLGKVWFPCIDEFTDKSTYEFSITTPSNKVARCNGYIVSQVTNPNGTITWNWKINEPIPTYLASMAVDSYIVKNSTLSGIPCEIACYTTDTNAVNNYFQHLPTAMSTYIDFYGAYPFNKVGYSLVNFNAGAMEHATNICIGRAFVAAGLTYETIGPHELSHMWWGDKVTCSTAEDMWLNEGFASYNENLFWQAQYGDSAYHNRVRTNHRKVLQFCHITDGSYLALNAVPQAYTYSTTVYDKGSDIVHTLRHFLGDSLYKAGSQAFMNNFAYNSASSQDLENSITNSTGINTSYFFNDWVYTPGFPHFSIDSVVYMPGGLDHYWVYTRQRAKGNTGHIYTMPVEITLSNGMQDTTVKVTIDSLTNVFHIAVIVGNANWIAIDRAEKMSDAITDFERIITSTGNKTMPETNTLLGVITASANPSTVRIEHNWVAPDGFKQSNPGIRISDYHYWKADGIFNTGFHTKCDFYYDGSTSTATGYIDNSLITGAEDSLVILYRSGTADDWHVVTNATLIMGSPVDKKGRISVDTLYKGEYALGYRDYSVAIKDNAVKQKAKLISAKPNPAQNICHIEFSVPSFENALLIVNDTSGKEVYRTTVFAHQQFTDWDCHLVSSGNYIVSLLKNNAVLDSLKITISK